MKDSFDIVVWHSRLGHTSKIVMKHIACLSNKVSDDFVCEACLLAKQTRLPFHRSSSSLSDVFELLHADIWGPYRQPSLMGHLTFLLL